MSKQKRKGYKKFVVHHTTDSVPSQFTHTHVRTHARTHARTHTLYTHTHKHIHSLVVTLTHLHAVTMKLNMAAMDTLHQVFPLNNLQQTDWTSIIFITINPVSIVTTLFSSQAPKRIYLFCSCSATIMETSNVVVRSPLRQRNIYTSNKLILCGIFLSGIKIYKDATCNQGEAYTTWDLQMVVTS